MWRANFYARPELMCGVETKKPIGVLYRAKYGSFGISLIKASFWKFITGQAQKAEPECEEDSGCLVGPRSADSEHLRLSLQDAVAQDRGHFPSATPKTVMKPSWSGALVSLSKRTAKC